MKPNHQIALLLVLTVLLGACSSRDPLDGTAWQLDAYRQSHPIEGTTITLAFEDGQASGSAGCNRYGGQYQVKRSELAFDALFATEMYCLDPEGVMQQEADYLGHLAAAERYELRDGQLLIYVTDDEALTFVPKQ